MAIDLEGLVRSSAMTALYASGGLACGCAIAGSLLPFYFIERLRLFGDILAVGLKSVPAFLFPLALAGLLGGPGWGGVTMKILVSGLICFFPILAGANDGRARVPMSLKRTCDAYGASRLRRLANAEYGWILASVVAGIKMAVPLAVVGAIVAEYVTGTEAAFSALGARMAVHRNSPAELWADIAAATFLGCGMFWVVAWLERVLERRLRLAQ